MEDKYKSMTVPELAGEDAFISWVINGENHQSWIHWQHQNPEKKITVAEAEQIVKSVAAIPVSTISEAEKNEIWNKIQHSIQPQEPVRNIYAFFRWSLAAAAALALLIWINSIRATERVIVEAGDKKEITLPESSNVVVNAESKVIFNKEKFADTRELKLDGEAFFKVNPGSRFTVRTDQGTVTVLGTSFNVVARPGRFEVSCHTGKVRVTNEANDQIEITAGEMVIEENDNLNVSTFVTTGTPAWIEGKFIFDNQELSVVFEELERQYDVEVELPNDLRNLRYTGLFESGNLTEALDLITWPRHLRYEVNGNKVIISK